MAWHTAPHPPEDSREDAPMTAAKHLRGLVAQCRPTCWPACPRFRPASAKRIYPVEGYCALAGAPGQIMIPSIAEYREFCAAGRHTACPWFQPLPGALPAPDRPDCRPHPRP